MKNAFFISIAPITSVYFNLQQKNMLLEQPFLKKKSDVAAYKPKSLKATIHQHQMSIRLCSYLGNKQGYTCSKSKVIISVIQINKST